MKIIYKSILIELATTFFLSLVALNFILMMEKLLRLSRFLSGIGASFIDLAKIILYLQPQLFLLTIPMALLLSTLLTYGRLNLDSELIILRNSGMNFRNIAGPVGVLGIMCFLLNIAVSFYFGPMSNMKLREEITNIIRIRTPLAIEEGRFNTSFKDTLIMVKKKISDETVREIFIYDNRNKNEPKVMIAKEGKISAQEDYHINFYLLDGYMHIAKGNVTTELFFKKYNMLLRLESDAPSRKIAELTPYEIIARIKKGNERRIGNLYLELYRRISLPFLCIILIFFGPPLAMMAGKSGRLGGLTLGLSVFTVYYMILIYGENLVKSGKIIHYIGGWLPTVIIGIFAFILFKKESCR